MHELNPQRWCPTRAERDSKVSGHHCRRHCICAQRTNRLHISSIIFCTSCSRARRQSCHGVAGWDGPRHSESFGVPTRLTLATPADFDVHLIKRCPLWARTKKLQTRIDRSFAPALHLSPATFPQICHSVTGHCEDCSEVWVVVTPAHPGLRSPPAAPPRCRCSRASALPVRGIDTSTLQAYVCRCET
jgi:hypothetical protein